MLPINFTDVFSEMAVLLLLSALVGGLALRLKQPLIVAFIAVGILVGPSALGWVQANDEIDLLAKLGIALLLFLVGLKLDLDVIRTMGPVALAAGLGQVIFTSVFGFLIAIGLGMAPVTATYVAVALTFSSTIIIVKLLSDKRELGQLHGRIAIGFLIVQDIVVVLVMIALTALGQAEDSHLGLEALAVLFKGALFLGGLWLLMRYVLTGLLHHLAHSGELLVLFAIAWAVALGALGVYLGFSKEVGAFLAGVSLASTPYREIIAARLVSLRDFLLLFFFVDLGVNLDLSLLGGQVLAALLFSVFVLVGNPLIVMIILGYMGYRKQTGFLAGLTVAQISEFSLILAALGLSQSHISADTVGLITLVGLITISVSTYMILYSQALYQKLEPWLGIFERKLPYREQSTGLDEAQSYDVILFGLGRMGALMANEIQQRGGSVLAVDFDPDKVRGSSPSPYPVYCGDMESPEFVAHLPLANARWVVSSVRSLPANLALRQALQDAGYQGPIAVMADPADIGTLEDSGIDLVLTPFRRAAADAVDHLLR